MKAEEEMSLRQDSNGRLVTVARHGGGHACSEQLTIGDSAITSAQTFPGP